jgi:copper chaperone
MSSTTIYTVAGMTCEHCVSAVTSELKSIDGVSDVQIALVVGGDSAVTITSAAPLESDAVAAAVDEAGDYRLVGV